MREKHKSGQKFWTPVWEGALSIVELGAEGLTPD